jgi:hypothetical protein
MKKIISMVALAGIAMAALAVCVKPAFEKPATSAEKTIIVSTQGLHEEAFVLAPEEEVVIHYVFDYGFLNPVPFMQVGFDGVKAGAVKNFSGSFINQDGLAGYHQDGTLQWHSGYGGNTDLRGQTWTVRLKNNGTKTYTLTTKYSYQF